MNELLMTVGGGAHLALLDPEPGPLAGQLDWQDDALCAQVDSEVFFPERGKPGGPAKRVCGMCNVRAECLDYALDNDLRFGIWGGASERERRTMRRARKAA